MINIDLNGPWRFRKIGDSEWKQGQVPGTLLTDLLRLGEVEDPFDRDNEYRLLPLFEADYEYEREFRVADEMLSSDVCLLRFEGLDTLAGVELNGQHLFAGDNMFRTYEMDVKPLLAAGENRLRVLFRSAVRFMRRKHAENPLFGIYPLVLEGYTHLRKAHYMSGWDWGPKLPDCGIWRSVTLCGASGARIADFSLRQEHRSGSVKLRLDLSVDQFGENAPLTAVLRVVTPQGETLERRESIGSRASLGLDVVAPRLWWPRGYGDQPLYLVTAQLTAASGDLLDERRVRVGLRTLTVNTDADEWGRRFAFEVNGVRIFSMGADYIPEDNLLGRLSRERSERLIRDCVRANFNTIRVWGGGLYPADDFYDLCDEYGILIWQDFMFACGVYDLNETFVRNALREIEDNVRRIRHHASLALLCGNNEIEMFFADGRIEPTDKNKDQYMSFFERRLPALVRELAPDTFYWPGSPSSGGNFFETNGENCGDGHYWEVWHGGKPFAEYRKTHYRYMSEFGFESMPHVRTIESFARPDERNLFSYVMECHQKNPSGNQKILAYLAETFRYPKDFASLVYVSQLLQAEAMRYGVEHWRRHRGRCMGTLYWQLNDCWPTLSWSGIDVYGRWKALHYMAKRFYAPILASICEEGTTVSLHVTNETMETVSGAMSWSLRNLKSEVLAEGEVPVAVPPLSALKATERDFTGVLDTVEKRHDAYVECALRVGDVVVSRSTAHFAPPKYLRLHDPGLRARVEDAGDRFVITLSAAAFAKFVELSFAGWDALFSDNYFDMNGGETRSVDVPKTDLSVRDASADEVAKRLAVRSLADSY